MSERHFKYPRVIYRCKELQYNPYSIDLIGESNQECDQFYWRENGRLIAERIMERDENNDIYRVSVLYTFPGLPYSASLTDNYFFPYISLLLNETLEKTSFYLDGNYDDLSGKLRYLEMWVAKEDDGGNTNLDSLIINYSVDNKTMEAFTSWETLDSMQTYARVKAKYNAINRFPLYETSIFGLEIIRDSNLVEVTLESEAYNLVSHLPLRIYANTREDLASLHTFEWAKNLDMIERHTKTEFKVK